MMKGLTPIISHMAAARNLDKQLKYLYGLGRFGIDPGLADMEAVLARLGNPEQRLRVIHVAGTNGKGSVAAMIESVLRAAGLRVGLHISPHMYAFNERMQIDRVPVSDTEALKLIDTVRAAADRAGVQLTFTEFTTAMALLYFEQQGVDWAVVEVAMGGRFDATNVVKAEVGVITNIGHDHHEFLGDNTLDIAREKAGIIKPNAAVVTGERDPVLIDYFRSVCGEQGAQLITDADVVTLAAVGTTWQSQTIRASGVWEGTYELPLLGQHQIANAAVALAALAQLQARGVTVMQHHVATGLAALRWEGRLDAVRQNPLVVVDGAHNQEGFEALAAFVRKMPQRDVLVVGVKAGRDIKTLTRDVVPLFKYIIATEGVYKPEEATVLAQKLGEHQDDVIAIPKPQAAVRRAIEIAGQEGSVVVAGSLYMIPEALAYLRSKEIVSPLIP